MHRHQMAKKRQIKWLWEGGEPILEESIKKYFGILCKQHHGMGWMNVTGNWKSVGHEDLMKITFLIGKFESRDKQQWCLVIRDGWQEAWEQIILVDPGPVAMGWMKE